MTRIFVELPSFRTEWKAMGLDDNDLSRLEDELLDNPKIGEVMRGTGGVRKMRFAFEHRGKSGSVRVIYIDFEVHEKIFLLTAYPKSEKDNLSKDERNDIHRLVDVLENQLNTNVKEGDHK